jgi:hypothetical protein
MKEIRKALQRANGRAREQGDKWENVPLSVRVFGDGSGRIVPNDERNLGEDFGKNTSEAEIVDLIDGLFLPEVPHIKRGDIVPIYTFHNGAISPKTTSVLHEQAVLVKYLSRVSKYTERWQVVLLDEGPAKGRLAPFTILGQSNY